MTNAQIHGKICCQQVDIEFDWKIENFFSRSVPKGQYFRSPSFNFCHRSWYLQAYPKGENGQVEEAIGLYLMTRKPGHPLKIEYSLGIKDVSGVTNVWGTYNKDFYEGCCGWGSAKCILRSELFRRKDELVPLDVLTVTFKLKSNGGLRAAESPVGCIRTEDQSSKEGCKKILQDIKSLWLSSESSDITIEVGDMKFKAHRVILGARSPVLSSMFKHGTSEKVSGVVTIKDCEPAVFGQFLHYIYTGELRELGTENAYALYAMADKYLVGEVKDLCVRFLQDTLCLNTICDIFTLCLLHNEKKLLETATCFFAKNMHDVVKSMEWRNFMRERTNWAQEITCRELELDGRKRKRALDTRRPNNTASKRIQTST